MKSFNSLASYLVSLERRSCPPEGFLIGTSSLEFTPVERQSGSSVKMNLTSILLEEPTVAFGAVFTKNAFPGYPVRIGREMLSQKSSQGVLINNKIANVCAPGGKAAALSVCTAFQDLMGTGLSAPVFPSSTGVIGWSLPEDAIKENLPDLLSSLQRDSVLPAAKGIMTTDSFPKVRTVKAGQGSICGIAKGAGMIEPNMATMLVFLMTDLIIERDTLRNILSRVTNRTFNRISIDSDQSTSDSVFLFSSCRKPSISEEEFEKALYTLCRDLAEDIVRNGEGTGHVIKVNIQGAESESQAAAFGKALINSPLSKTAVFGNDPNVGRFVQAVGDYAGNNGIVLDEESVEIRLGEEIVFKNGEFLLDSEKELRLSDYLKERSLPTPCPGYPEHERVVDVTVFLGLGQKSALVLGSDLSYEYVRENADYRS
ncbi:MAG: hypothetical protein B6241_12115 [Spirochaetaceae bacterium 4572_59]|nr:MAG: hypothetical protein B6241_12115 [Spirochaetaceae bacterium 4572_59]